ncbi:hypothetical protein FHS85_004614 [Rhodoligotrophos appendicifer]|uniref:hypothetical protein n=1 Tax=Rhodoligotrophos appendicifer TaxID=987056 RepID=UPI001478AD5F|nr:hypothetical protein [Rhodoligotrophos appendicifer]
MTARRILLPSLLTGLALLAPIPAQANSCGAQTKAAAGETMQAIALRCDVALDDLQGANPNLQSGPLAAGMVVDMPGFLGGSLSENARNAVRDAGDQIKDAAGRAGKSVSDFLRDEPDLNRDILEFGESLGLPGVKAPPPETGAEAMVTPQAGRPGDQVEIRASGFRGDVAVKIYATAATGQQELLGSAVADAAGRVDQKVTVPNRPAGEKLVFAVETERMRLSTEPFAVTGAP